MFSNKLSATVRLIMFTLFVPGFAYGQINEYLNHNPVWQVNSQCSFSFPCVLEEDYNYYVNGDTIFNGLTYKKIYRKGTGSYSWFGPPPPGPGCSGTYNYVNTFSEYYVRSDAKQMYIRHFGDTAEYLLYDFDLAVGDSLPITFNNYDSSIVVTAIDSFSTPYGYRKRFAVAGNTWATELLEGIGHDRGFLEPVSTPLECGFTLNCFSLNDTSYYPSPGLTCELTIGVEEAPPALNSVNVSPNPFLNATTITWNKSFKNAELILFDIRGKAVSRIDAIDGDHILFDRANLDSGIYFFEIRESETSLSVKGKLLIQ